MALFSCLDGCIFLSSLNTLCSTCNVIRGCLQCSCFSVDSIRKIFHHDKQTQQLKLEYIDGEKYIDLSTGDTIMVQIFAKPKIEEMPF
jgi:hypothetical protein